MADYHLRATHGHMQGHHGLGNHFHHQQGYHRARMHREEGGMSRRLAAGDGGSVCVDISPDQRKAEQCLRLASCARNYNLYDMFVFFFGDDYDFETGTVDSKEKIEANDEKHLRDKVRILLKCAFYSGIHAHTFPRCPYLPVG